MKMLMKIGKVIGTFGFIFFISAIESNPLLFGVLGLICMMCMFACAGEVEEDEAI